MSETSWYHGVLYDMFIDCICCTPQSSDEGESSLSTVPYTKSKKRRHIQQRTKTTATQTDLSLMEMVEPGQSIMKHNVKF